MQRQAIVVSERLMFRKTFVKLLHVLDARFDVVEHVEGISTLQAIPDQDRGIVLVDCGAMDESALQMLVLQILTTQAEACVVIVLDEQDDNCVSGAMQAGATGVLVKAAPPQVLVDMLGRVLQGERCRPAPTTTLVAEEIPDAMRKQLSAREQKMLRLVMGGHSISTTARQLSLTPARVVSDMRRILGVIRGRSLQ